MTKQATTGTEAAAAEPALAGVAGMFGMVPGAGASVAEHIGDTELPFVEVADGATAQLLYADLNTNTWVIRTKFRPGAKIETHYHTGQIFAFTRAGSWFYKEYPETVNHPGSFLFEPAHSIHTLMVPEDQYGETDVWFVMHGANVNLDATGNVTAIVDGKATLLYYRAVCGALGLSCDKLLVKGE